VNAAQESKNMPKPQSIKEKNDTPHLVATYPQALDGNLLCFASVVDHTASG
jgi:hypothetical protein